MTSRRGADARRRRALRIEALEERVALSGQEIAPTFDSVATSLIEGVALRLDLRVDCFEGGLGEAIVVDWGDGTPPTSLSPGAGRAYLGHIYAPSQVETVYTIMATLGGGEGEAYELATFSPKVASPDFVAPSISDAEKAREAQSELCWAAGAANALWCSEWGRISGRSDAGGTEARFESEDDIYEYFVAHFENGASSAYYAIEWFFTGVYALEDYEGAARLLQDGGGFYADVDLTEVLGYFSYSTSSEAGFTHGDALELLRSGYGVLASLGYWDGDLGAFVGAHTISIWGFQVDATLDVGSPGYYRTLIATDSDDDAYLGREAPNRTQVFPLVWNDAFRRLSLVGYRADVETLIEEWIALAPRPFEVETEVRDAAFALLADEFD